MNSDDEVDVMWRPGTVPRNIPYDPTLKEGLLLVLDPAALTMTNYYFCLRSDK